MHEILIKRLIENSISSRDDLVQYKRAFARDNKLAKLPSNIQLLSHYKQLLRDGKIQASESLEQILKKRPIRSMSGIVSVQVLTKPYRCPGKCIFCPNDFTMPKSYINTEPGAMRALLNNFDPIKQVYNRLLSLTMTGHKTDKVEMIVLGGTWDVYPDAYKEDFVKGLYDACNTFPDFFKNVKLGNNQQRALQYTIKDYDIVYPKTIEESIRINETGQHRVIGLTVETRPEYVTDDNCRFWRRLGVTRLEMGIQSSNDEVLAMNKRGHDHECSRQAVHKLRQYGFKMSVHLMPGLYGSDYEKDIQTFKDVYDDPYVRPDEIKFYPTSVIPNTELYDLYREGKYKPLETDVIKKLIRKCFMDIIPPYTRIKRLIRDIPSTEIVAGSSVTNLSQLTHKELKEKLRNTDEIKQLYARLYQDLEVYASIDERLENDIFPPFVKEVAESVEVSDTTVKPPSSPFSKGEIKTTIIGDKPDLESYRNFVSLDTRSREIRHKFEQLRGLPKPSNTKNEEPNLVIRHYLSSVGEEFFISFEDRLGYLYGFVRLLLPQETEAIKDFAGLGVSYAQVRELHVYGHVEAITSGDSQTSKSTNTQHTGFGRKLMQTAETISHRAGYAKLSVIAGVGVMQYYEKIGYKLEGTYMVKEL